MYYYKKKMLYKTHAINIKLITEASRNHLEGRKKNSKEEKVLLSLNKSSTQYSCIAIEY